MDTDTSDFIDDYWALHRAADDEAPMWDSPLDQVERWPTTEPAHTADMASRLRTAAEEAHRRMDAGEGPRATLRTAADAARLLAAREDSYAELELPHPDMGLHAMLHWAVTNYPLATAEDGERWIAKLAGLPAAAEQLAARLAHAAGAGRAPLARHSRTAVERLDHHLSLAPEDDPLHTQPAPTSLGDDAVAAWRSRVTDEIRASVRPALSRLRDALAEVAVPAGRDDDHPGLVHHDGGEARYAELLQAYTVPGATAEEVHRIGMDRLAWLEGEYARLGQRAFGTGDVTAVRERLRGDDLHCADAPAVLAAATELHRRAVAEAPAWFERVPASACEVRTTDHGAMAFYSRPASDGTRAGAFFLNTTDPTTWGPSLASTVFHEGIPGHHFQLALAVEDRGLHDLHRELFLPAFGEGWGLYAEGLADEIGLYRDDVDRLGMLGADAMRACRLVVDTGLHALGWTRDRAIEFMVANTTMGVGEVTAEVDRYIGVPAQATSYLMGRLEIEGLRDAARTRLGDAFDLRGFHAVVLGHGMVSLPALRELVAGWAPAA